MKDSRQIPKGYKPSPLGPIPIDWHLIELGNAIIFPKRQVDPKVSPYNTWPLIAPNHIESGSGILIKIETAKEQGSISGKYLVEKGDVIYSKIRPYLKKVYYSTIKGLCSADMYPLKSTSDLDRRFLYYLLLSERFTFFATSQSGRTGIPKVNREEMSEFPALLPPIKEQTAIANLLNTWDKAINTLTQLIAQKEQRKKWLMQQLLTGKKRLKGFKDEWKEYHISDLFERVTRRNIDGNTNIVTISAQRGFVKQDDFFNKVVASEITENYFLVKHGEFCYNKSYSNGYPWGATKRLKDFDEAVVTTLYICFSIKNKKLSSGDFFESFFEANLLDRGLTKIAHEGGRAHGLLNVTPSDFFSLKVRVPEVEEQKSIASFLSMINEELKHLLQKEECLKDQKRGLMQILLTGKKRLKI